MTAHVAPVLRVVDATAAAAWYEQLGFAREWEHQFGPGLPLYEGIACGEARMHLSEHAGDALYPALVYLNVDDVDAVASAVGVTAIDDMPWGRDFVPGRDLPLSHPERPLLRGQAVLQPVTGAGGST